MRKYLAALLSVVIIISSNCSPGISAYAGGTENKPPETRFDESGVFQLSIDSFAGDLLDVFKDLNVDLGTWVAESGIFKTKDGRRLESCYVAKSGRAPDLSKDWYVSVHGYDEKGVFSDGSTIKDIVRLNAEIPMDEPEYAAATLISMVMVCDPTLSKTESQSIIVELTEEVSKDQKNTHIENGICYVIYANPIFKNSLVFEIYANENA